MGARNQQRSTTTPTFSASQDARFRIRHFSNNRFNIYPTTIFCIYRFSSEYLLKLVWDKTNLVVDQFSQHWSVSTNRSVHFTHVSAFFVFIYFPANHGQSNAAGLYVISWAAAISTAMWSHSWLHAVFYQQLFGRVR